MVKEGCEPGEEAGCGEAVEFVVEKGEVDDFENEEVHEERPCSGNGGSQQRVDLWGHFHEDAEGEGRGEAEAEEEPTEEHRDVPVPIEGVTDDIEESCVVEDVCEDAGGEEREEFWVFVHVSIIARERSG